MKKLEAIRVALQDLVEELEAEERRFNLVTDRIIAEANGLAPDGISCRSEAKGKYLVMPSIRLDILGDSFVVEGALVAPEVLGKGELVVKAIPRLTFLLNGPRDLAVMERLKALFGEFREMSAGENHSPGGYRSLGEFKFLVFFLTASPP